MDDGPILYERAERCKQEGNALLAKGDFADACERYDQGLLALVNAEKEGDVDQQKIVALRVALHLNAALAHIRRSTLKAAIDHASGALASEPENVKALYRRGLARSSLAEHAGYDEE